MEPTHPSPMSQMSPAASDSRPAAQAAPEATTPAATAAVEEPAAAAASWPGWPLFWILLVGAIGWGLGGYPLLDPDQGRNAEVARGMAPAGGFVPPRLAGPPYLAQ